MDEALRAVYENEQTKKFFELNDYCVGKDLLSEVMGLDTKDIEIKRSASVETGSEALTKSTRET